MPEERFDSYVLSHAKEHAALVIEFHDHEHLVSHPGIEPRVRALEDFALQTKTFAMMLRVIFGASVVGAIVSIVTLFTLVEHLAT